MINFSFNIFLATLTKVQIAELVKQLPGNMDHRNVSTMCKRMDREELELTAVGLWAEAGYPNLTVNFV